MVMVWISGGKLLKDLRFMIRQWPIMAPRGKEKYLATRSIFHRLAKVIPIGEESSTPLSMASYISGVEMETGIPPPAVMNGTQPAPIFRPFIPFMSASLPRGFLDKRP